MLSGLFCTHRLIHTSVLNWQLLVSARAARAPSAELASAIAIRLSIPIGKRMATSVAGEELCGGSLGAATPSQGTQVPRQRPRTHAPTHANGQPQSDGAMAFDCGAVDDLRCTGLDCVGKFMMVSSSTVALSCIDGSFPFVPAQAGTLEPLDQKSPSLGLGSSLSRGRTGREPCDFQIERYSSQPAVCVTSTAPDMPADMRPARVPKAGCSRRGRPCTPQFPKHSHLR